MFQVANIGEKVRRVLTFDNEDNSSPSSANNINGKCSDRNLYKSLMKRSYHCNSEYTPDSGCKKIAVSDSYSQSKLSKSLDSDYSKLEKHLEDTHAYHRPESPATLLGNILLVNVDLLILFFIS